MEMPKETTEGKHPLISIIVPVYNVAPYLERCVESLSAQTYWNLEVILVDDGSTDRSGSMSDSFPWEDERIRVIHQSNRGPAAARNAGILASRGEYLTFVNSDDYVADEYVECLYRALVKGGAQMSLCGFTWVDENGHVEPRQSPLKDEVLTGTEALEKLQQEGAVYYTTGWAALFERSLFFDTGISFPVGRLWEDVYVIHRIYHACERVAVIREELYWYVQHEGSLLSTPGIARMDRVEALCGRFWCYKEWGLSDHAAAMQEILHLAYFSVRLEMVPHSLKERVRLHQVDTFFARTYREAKGSLSGRERWMLAMPDLYAATMTRRKPSGKPDGRGWPRRKEE